MPGQQASLDGFPRCDRLQIFDSRAAFRRLTNELEEIFKAQDFNMASPAGGPCISARSTLCVLRTLCVALAYYLPDN